VPGVGPTNLLEIKSIPSDPRVFPKLNCQFFIVLHSIETRTSTFVSTAPRNALRDPARLRLKAHNKQGVKGLYSLEDLSWDAKSALVWIFHIASASRYPKAVVEDGHRESKSLWTRYLSEKTKDWKLLPGRKKTLLGLDSAYRPDFGC
jgi:hypothetical protein